MTAAGRGRATATATATAWVAVEGSKSGGASTGAGCWRRQQQTGGRATRLRSRDEAMTMCGGVCSWKNWSGQPLRTQNSLVSMLQPQVCLARVGGWQVGPGHFVSLGRESRHGWGLGSGSSWFGMAHGAATPCLWLTVCPPVFRSVWSRVSRGRLVSGPAKCVVCYGEQLLHAPRE